MDHVTPTLFVFFLLSTLVLAILAGMLMIWGWAAGRLFTGRSLLPEAPLVPVREVPWGGGTVVLVVVAYLLVNTTVANGYLTITGRHRPAAKDKPVAAKPEAKAVPPGTDDASTEQTPDEAAEAEPKPGEAPDRKAHEGSRDKEAGGDELTLTEQMFLLAVINSLLLILVPSLLWWTSGATLADLGISIKDWERQMAVGFGTALLITPPVYAVQSLAVRIWKPNQHPVEEMVLEQFSAGVAYLALLSTVVLAPMIEEVLFRGVVQRWLTRLLGVRSEDAKGVEGSDSLDIAGDLDAGIAEGVREAREGNFTTAAATHYSQPASPRYSTAAIVVTSWIFAAVHAPQWPAPIAIFLLSLAMGAVYQRTGSLLASITLHGTFNGFSTLLLLLAALGRQLPVLGACIQ